MALAARLLSFERDLYTRLRARADRRLLQRAARPAAPHLLTGERGEDAAYFYLRGLGYTVVARRWASARLRGDLDLVAWDGVTLVVFEVKTRTKRDFAPAEIQVDRDKRNQLRALSSAYLKRIPPPWRDAVPLRFDVLSIYLAPNAEPEFEHFAASFPFRAPPEDLPRRFRPWN
jgi:putative endonuclease